MEAGLPDRRPDLLGIYIHFPWCVHKCAYCDFYSVGLDRTGTVDVSSQLLNDYESALLAELSIRRRQFADFSRVNSVFFGGGTASMLPAESVQRILAALRQNFDFDPDVEITLEGNPESLTQSHIRALRDAGINRIHSGVQSLKPDILRTLDRYYDEERYANILDTLQNSAVPNRGADLMYGVPGQSRASFEEDLARVIDAGVTHLSLYSLTVEHGTAYDVSVRKKESMPPDDTLQSEIFRDLPEMLRASGFVQYEVSNFARGGLFSRHNLRYWLYEPTLALGPGAHGFDGSRRYGNLRNTLVWQKDPAGAAFAGHEPHLEIPLCVLRIALPLPLSMLFELLESNLKTESAFRGRVTTLLEGWARAGYGRLRDSEFTWQLPGLMFLDDRVRELQELLSAEVTR